MAQYLSRLRRPPKKLAPLAKKLVKLDSVVVSMVSQELCHLLAIFLDCSSSPYRSLLISKTTLCRNDFVDFVVCRRFCRFFFRLGVVYKNGQAFFLLWRHSLPKSKEKQ